MKDRRQQERESARHRVLYRRVDHEQCAEEVKESFTANASDLGLALFTKESITTDETLTLEIYADSAKKPINAVGRVVWCREKNDSEFLVGVEFVWIGSPLRSTPSLGSQAGPMWSFL